MKRFEIKNKASGKITHFYEAMEPMPHQSEWGILEHEEIGKNLNGDDIFIEMPVLDEEGVQKTDAEGNPIFEKVPVMVTVPADFEVIETDITEEFELREWQKRIRADMPQNVDELFEAIFEKLAENRSEKFDALQVKRLAAKAKHPKPVKNK